MIVVLEQSATEQQISKIRKYLVDHGLQIREIVGEKETILGAVGQVVIDPRTVELLSGVSKVIPISKPYKLASREFQKEDSVFNIGPVKIGGSRLVVIAGPCAVESREQIIEAAKAVREAGAVILRGGAYKPRTSPYSFQGLGEEGLKYLKEAGEITGMPVATEVVSTSDVELMAQYIDVYQIGARNMQNFELLKKVGSMNMPVILKRGLCATINEWLMAAEYLLSSGTNKVILCERGIRTYETYTRNTLDISAIPVVQKLSHLPVIVDPSHATGLRNKVLPMSLASVAAGADGLIVEVHPNPEEAMSDGPQSLYPVQFQKLMADVQAMASVVEKELARLPHKSISNKSKDKAVPTGLKVAFQGEHGAYGELAVTRYFSQQEVEPFPVPSFADVFEGVLKGDFPWGLVPLENTLGGSIHDNYDLFHQYPDIKIFGEIKLRVRHNLMVNKGTRIEEVKEAYSHPQALAQCTAFLKKHDIKPMVYYDTAGAAAMVAQEKDPSKAAIASIRAAEFYDLEILDEGIETDPLNFTRFALIGRDDLPQLENPDRASLLFALPDETGSLVRCLTLLAKYDLNLTKLESRPIAGKPWSYMFYTDINLPAQTEKFHQALEAMKDVVSDLRVLGLYKA
ncbi:MAG: 3-deoxy-7-phosphoheptulonate synthase [Spirochaetaceae bacterium]|jgi:3-deoxy-7-phosphoheptulonate synthase|nr:3-deoxy-7-phosphoheptulonate synthase [Spirochaetaceae bacterium]